MSETRMQKFRKGLRNAFSLESPYGPLKEADYELLQKLAEAIVRRQMATPALLFLGSIRPLNYIGSQAMIFLRPFLAGLLNPEKYDRLSEIMERREGVGALMDAIEAEQARTEGLAK